MKVLLGMPTYLGIHPEVVKNLIDFDIDSQREKNDLEVMFPRGSILSQSRNMIMREAVKVQADWVLMWDSDVSVSDKAFFPGMIETAFKNDAAIVGLPVMLKSGTQYNCAWKSKFDSLGYVNAVPKKETDGWYEPSCYLPRSPETIDVIGTGIMLINMAWINKNFPNGPWFSTIDTETGCFPEDWFFCEQVKKKGGKIMVDPRFKTVHYGERGFES